MNPKPEKLKCADNAGKVLTLPIADPKSPVAAPESAIPSPHDGLPAPMPADSFTKIKADSLKRKQRADAFLNTLTEAQCYQIMDWMDEIENLSEVHRRVTAPLPQGLGLKVNLSTLRRLRNAWRAEVLCNHTDTMFDVITDMEAATDLSQSPRVQTAINHILHEKAFELAQTHPGSNALKDILTSIQKLSALEYKRQKIALEHAKLNRRQQSAASLNTTRHHRVDLNIISTPASQHPPSQASQAPPTLPDARQAVEIIAPLPEVVL